MSATSDLIAVLLSVEIQKHRFRYGNEIELQDGLAALFTRHDLTFEREVRFDAKDRIDFMVFGDVGLEVKCKGRLGEVHRQLVRYARQPRIATLMLVTDRHQLTQGLPDTLHGTTLVVVSLLGGLR